ncbi:superoxide dismutase family protein [Escherichia coli]
MVKITIQKTPYGLLFTPDLHSLPAGIHGFHVHENASCAPALKDGKKLSLLYLQVVTLTRKKTGKHLGPWSPDGHRVISLRFMSLMTEKATYPVLAPRLSELKELDGRSLMLHAGGDNHDDHPEPLGGGGARIACGIIP